VKYVGYISARELISRLLQIKMRKRFTADKSLAHDWLQVIVVAVVNCCSLASWLSVCVRVDPDCQMLLKMIEPGSDWNIFCVLNAAWHSA